MFGLSVTVAGTGLGVGAVGFLVSLTPQHTHGSPRTSARSGVLPFLGLRLGVYRAVLFVSPYLWVRVRCVMCRLLGGRWRRSLLAVTWLRRLVVLTVRLSAPSSRRWVPACHRPLSRPGSGCVRGTVGRSCAGDVEHPAGGDPGVRFVVWGPWPLAENLLVDDRQQPGAGPLTNRLSGE